MTWLATGLVAARHEKTKFLNWASATLFAVATGPKDLGWQMRILPYDSKAEPDYRWCTIKTASCLDNTADSSASVDMPLENLRWLFSSLVA